MSTSTDPRIPSLDGLRAISIALWQQPFLNRASDAAVAAFPLNIILTVALALASYYLVEQPSLRLRKLLERRLARTTSSPGPAAAQARL